MVSTQVILMLAEDACSVKRSAEPRDHNTNLQGSPSTLSCMARVVGAFTRQLAEDDDLLKQENPALFAARQNAAVLLPHTEGLLLQQLPLGRQLPLDNTQVSEEVVILDTALQLNQEETDTKKNKPLRLGPGEPTAPPGAPPIPYTVGRWHLRREGGGGRDGGRHIETLTSKIFSGAAE
ncbi:hypothetical protein INR49_021997 [Caranx melampygus]|nr:hypothetical protein INR49_021997 [Caranx melampygus]